MPADWQAKTFRLTLPALVAALDAFDAAAWSDEQTRRGLATLGAARRASDPSAVVAAHLRRMVTDGPEALSVPTSQHSHRVKDTSTPEGVAVGRPWREDRGLLARVAARLAAPSPETLAAALDALASRGMDVELYSHPGDDDTPAEAGAWITHHTLDDWHASLRWQAGTGVHCEATLIPTAAARVKLTAAHSFELAAEGRITAAPTPAALRALAEATFPIARECHGDQLEVVA
jgi:hypothetical protein